MPDMTSPRDPLFTPFEEHPPVLLVGAGPGDPDLLTMAAVKALMRAEVVLYDALVSPEILALAPRDAERVCVGKRSGNHSMAQAAINDLLLAKARTGRRVVRLKGGDPLLFGRGGEEMLHLQAHGIPVTVIPGITAALGCAASVGVPLTHRGLANGVTLHTAHGRDGGLPLGAADLAEHTQVVYMGRDRIGAVVAAMMARGLPPDTPALVIENGTLPQERRCLATLADIAERAAAELGNGPALILVGRTVGLASGTVRDMALSDA